VLWYYHIGKCAGTSVLEWMLHLKATGGLTEVIDLSWDLGANFKQFDQHHLQPLVSSMTAKQVVAVHHHHQGPGLWGMYSYFSSLQEQLNARGCALVRWTTLRQPEPRLVSHLNHDLQLLHGSGIDQPTHDEYFRRVLSQAGPYGKSDFQNQYDNTQVRYTLNNWGYNNLVESFPMPFGAPNADALDTAIRILDGFEVVGLVEEIDKSFRRVTDIFSLPQYAERKANAGRKGFQHPLPDDVKDLIKQRTRLEWQLYQHYQLKSAR